ncbi:MAG TPA: anti-sigma factor [Bryobacteraceae bacterium]|nr:anti-sigma factor [Bryobacteraceae bacterium]
MSCETNRELLELYALGVLEPEERGEVEEHLGRNCPACTAALRSARELNIALLSSAPLEEPSPLLRSRVVNSIRPPELATSVTRKAPLAWIAIAAGLAAATVWLGLENRTRTADLIAARKQLQTTEARSQELGRALDFLRHPETRPASVKPGANQPRGTYFVNPQSGVMLIASNLPIPAPGRAYELWVIPKGQAPRPAGVFRPDATGSAVHLQAGAIDLASTAAFAITEEPEAGSAAPTTTPFLVTPAEGL